MRYDELKKIIANQDGVDFAPFGQGVSEDWIERAEQRLQFVFPESYKWWLKHYRGGEIYGDEIFSIYELDFDTVVGGDVVYMNELNRRNGFSDAAQLVICECDDGMFYLQWENQLESECPVFRDGEHYANNFLEFLLKRIVE